MQAFRLGSMQAFRLGSMRAPPKYFNLVPISQQADVIIVKMSEGEDRKKLLEELSRQAEKSPEIVTPEYLESVKERKELIRKTWRILPDSKRVESATQGETAVAQQPLCSDAGLMFFARDLIPEERVLPDMIEGAVVELFEGAGGYITNNVFGYEGVPPQGHDDLPLWIQEKEYQATYYRRLFDDWKEAGGALDDESDLPEAQYVTNLTMNGFIYEAWGKRKYAEFLNREVLKRARSNLGLPLETPGTDLRIKKRLPIEKEYIEHIVGVRKQVEGLKTMNST